MEMTIYFDMDGTLANFYAVKGWLESLNEYDARPYREAQPMFDPDQMRELIEAAKERGYRIGIISWLSKTSTPEFDKEVRKAKREWLEKFFPYAEEIHIVKYGTKKYRFAKTKEDILFDDEARNINEWKEKIGRFNAFPADRMIDVLWGGL